MLFKFRRMLLNRQVTLTMLIVSMCSSVTLAVINLEDQTSSSLIGAPKSESEKEITLRNTTNQIVHYAYKPANSYEEPIRRTIMPGVVDRLMSAIPLDLDYQAGGTTIITRIEPGMSYSFRYNEEDDLELFEGSHGREDAPDLAPFVPTPMIVVERRCSN